MKDGVLEGGVVRTVVVSRHVAGDAGVRECEDAFAGLCARHGGARVVLTPSLYHLADSSLVWERVAAVVGPLLVASWLHPRALLWLLRRRGVTVPEGAALNLGAFASAEECFRQAQAFFDSQPVGEDSGIEEISDETTARWYPVIDQERCEGCGHCLEFCIFGVYALGAHGRPEVTHPDLCKPGCPACSRICPQGAILFPLYTKEGAIAGAPGEFMTPDPAARRLYYARAKHPCPTCGREAGPDPRATAVSPDVLCRECGRTRPLVSEPEAALEPLDSLISYLDELAARPPSEGRPPGLRNRRV